MDSPSDNPQTCNNLPDSFSSQSLDGDAAKLPLVEQVQFTVNKFLEHHLNEMFDSLDDILFSMSEHAETRKDQRTFFDSFRYLRTQRRDFIRHYQDWLTRSESEADVHNWLHSDKADGLAHRGVISQLENTGADEALAMEVSLRRFSLRYRDQLSCLARRLYQTSDLSDASRIQKLLMADNWCQSFVHAMQPLKLDSRIRLMMWKHFEFDLLNRLDGLYNTLDRLFSEVLKNKVEEIVLESSSDGQKPAESKPSIKNEPVCNLSKELKLIRKLKPGQQVEFIGEKGAILTAKLTVKDKTTGRYIFENCKGMKLMEKTADDLAREIYNGTLRVLRKGLLAKLGFRFAAGKLKK
ncbi:DUF1631 family protein [Spongorhabdus nitratireducens]